MITQAMIEECTGCGACADNCPKNCISMKYDKEGFRIPVVDQELCIHCGICKKKCPMKKDIYQMVERTKAPKAYAAFSKNEFIHKTSATGGIFFELANYVIQERGVVFGAVGNCLDGVFHTKAETLEQLKKMQGSKYAQSNTIGIYREVKSVLKTGKKVLFSGTPCQIGALYSVLDCDYENLLTMDVICHGVPSEKVLHKFIEELEQRKHKKVIHYYRDKEEGWKPPRYAFDYEDGTKESFVSTEIPYNRGFIQNLYVRKICTHCQFAKIPRIADITAGDWFGGGLGKKLDPDNKGLSMVTVNSPKGYRYLRNLLPVLFVKEYPIEKAVNESEHLGKPPKENILRPIFFEWIEKYSFFRVTEILVPNKIIYRVIRKIFIIFIKNKRKIEEKIRGNK